MKKIKLTRGKYAIVDDEDYEELVKHKWYAVMGKSGNFYAKRDYRIKERVNVKSCLMHRHIAKCPRNMSVDHANGDGLDNRKSNLRVCTVQENNWNMRVQTKNKHSKYKGVTFCSYTKKFKAYYSMNDRQIYIGRFEDERSAGLAYNNAVKIAFGEFARLNIIEKEKVVS